MKGIGVKKLAVIFAGAIICAGVVGLTCSPTKPSASTKTDDLIVTNQISGWSIDSSMSDTVTHVTDANMNDVVDGGKVDYCGSCNGTGPMKTGIVTYLKNAQYGYKLLAFVIDYGSASNATAEFTLWANKIAAGSQDTISPFTTSTAVGNPVNGAITAYAHFGDFYVELQFTDYNGSTSLAAADASTFFTYYNSKIK